MNYNLNLNYTFYPSPVLFVLKFIIHHALVVLLIPGDFLNNSVSESQNQWDNFFSRFDAHDSEVEVNQFVQTRLVLEAKFKDDSLATWLSWTSFLN